MMKIKMRIIKSLCIAALLWTWVSLAGCAFSQQVEVIPTNTPKAVAPSDQVTAPTMPVSSPSPTLTQTTPLASTHPVTTITPFAMVTPLTVNTPDVLPIPPTGWLAFQSLSGGLLQISIARTDGRGARVIIESVAYADHPSWSPDGQWIALDGATDWQSGEGAIYLARADGSSLALLISQDGTISKPSWSPDGRFIVYRLTSDGANDQDRFVDLFVVEVSTGIVQRLTNTPGVYEHDPVYSPDGSRIAFATADEDAHFDLMVMDANGENLTQLTHTSFNSAAPSWSPDGQRIAFVSGDDFDTVSLINVDGSGFQELPNGPGYVRYLTWSPDGEWIVFTGSPPSLSGFHLFAIRADGSGLQELPILLNTSINNPTWSPLPALQAGGAFVITELGEGLNLRASPALDGEVVEKLHAGDEILVLEGPVDASQYLWWRVRLGDGDLEGWVAENPGWFMYPGD